MHPSMEPAMARIEEDAMMLILKVLEVVKVIDALLDRWYKDYRHYAVSAGNGGWKMIESVNV